jgi:hypothetical protein
MKYSVFSARHHAINVYNRNNIAETKDVLTYRWNILRQHLKRHEMCKHSSMFLATAIFSGMTDLKRDRVTFGRMGNANQQDTESA